MVAPLLEMTVKARPISWKRTDSLHGQRFTPRRQRNFQTVIKQAALNQYGLKRGVYTGAVTVDLRFVFQIPKSWTVAKKRMAREGHLGEQIASDIDNLAKNISDALNKVIYADDRQIVEMSARKLYGPEDLIVVVIKPAGSQPLVDDPRPETKTAEAATSDLFAGAS